MRRSGFTLLEVLASVAVLAIVYTVLASSAMQGLATEGESYRRLQASLVADRVLAELEAGLLQGAPPLGPDEREEGDFVIETETRALDLGPFALAAQERPASRGAESRGGTDAKSGGVAFQLLTVPADSSAPPLVEIYVAVRWVEGQNEQLVTRTTYAADVRVVGPVLEGLSSEQAAAAEQKDDADPGEEPPGVFPEPEEPEE